MAFKLKDLIIDVLHRDRAGLLCGPATKPEAALACGPATKGDPAAAARICGPATIGDALARICGPATLFDGLQGEDLATLKRQLEEALTRVRENTPEESQASLPQSLAEVEDLEKKLQGALDELREHKKGLA